MTPDTGNSIIMPDIVLLYLTLLIPPALVPGTPESAVHADDEVVSLH